MGVIVRLSSFVRLSIQELWQQTRRTKLQYRHAHWQATIPRPTQGSVSCGLYESDPVHDQGAPGDLELAVLRFVVVVCHLESSSLEAAFDVEAFVCLGAVQYTLCQNASPVSKCSPTSICRHDHPATRRCVFLDARGPQEPQSSKAHSTL